MGFVSTRIRSAEFIGPLTGNADSASFASTASYVIGSIESASFSTTASYAFTASYLSGSITNAINAETASYALTSSYLELTATASYALTASYVSGSGNAFPFEGDAKITGSLTITGSLLQGPMQQRADGEPGWPALSFGYQLFSYALTDETAAFIEYSVDTTPGAPQFAGYNQRAGIIAASIVSTETGYAVEWSDNSTADIGNTSDFEVGLGTLPGQNGGIELLGYVNSVPGKNYRFKHIIRTM
jgi:hypothetical protein